MTEQDYVVIGSNCFTGAHLVDALLERPGARVLGVSRSPEYDPVFLPYKQRDTSRFEFHQLDLYSEFAALAELLDGRRPAVVINVAALSEVALSHERPLEYFRTNTEGTVRLCDHLRRQSYLRRYVHISSAEIYGPCTGAVKEDAPLNPSTPYAVSKAAADMFIGTLMKNFGFPATLICSTNVYGAHQQLFKIIPRTAIFLKLGKTIELHGGGTAVKSFIHIRDVVAGLLRTLAGEHLGKFHFSVPSDLTVADIVRRVCQQVGRDFEQATRVVGERLGQDSRYWLDCTRAQQELKWRPQIELEQGIAETTGWIERNWETIRQKPLTYIHKVPGTVETSPRTNRRT